MDAVLHVASILWRTKIKCLDCVRVRFCCVLVGKVFPCERKLVLCACVVLFVFGVLSVSSSPFVVAIPLGL